MEVRVRRPAVGALRAGKDLRTRVTFLDESLPLPLHIYFLDIGDDETGEHQELRNVGFKLGGEIRDMERVLETPELTAVTLRRVVERFPHWLELARAHAAWPPDTAPVGDMARGLKRVKPARLDKDWYRMIAAEYRRHVEEEEPGPVSAIAKSHGVTPSAASRWVKTARQKGLLEDVAEPVTT